MGYFIHTALHSFLHFLQVHFSAVLKCNELSFMHKLRRYMETLNLQLVSVTRIDYINLVLITLRNLSVLVYFVFCITIQTYLFTHEIDEDSKGLNLLYSEVRSYVCVFMYNATCIHKIYAIRQLSFCCLNDHMLFCTYNISTAFA